MKKQTLNFSPIAVMCSFMNQELEILYRDDHFVAVNKPSGIFVHRSELDRKAPFAMGMVRDQVGGWVYPVHRLDRPTSGVLLFGLSPDAASRMSALFRDRLIEKRYVAVVRGHAPESVEIDYPLKPEKGALAREAVTSFKNLGNIELPFPAGKYETARYSLVEAKPLTGRLHQIRKHLAHIFHPVVGDTMHGDGVHNRLFREKFGSFRLLLFAKEISFAHPFTGKSVRIVASPGEGESMLFKRLGWENALSGWLKPGTLQDKGFLNEMAK